MVPQTAPRVLIVDDHQGSRLSVGTYLTATGWRVRMMETVNEVLTVLTTRAFDAILVDLCIDGGSPEGGIRIAEAARAVRRSMKIVVLSGYDMSSEESARVLRSADAFLSKPSPLSVVDRALRGLTMLSLL